MRLVLDFETYFDDQYSLKEIRTLEYVRDERFQVHGAAIKVGNQPTTWLNATDLKKFLDDQNAADVELICHNTYFDGLILFEHYRFVPGVYRDTQAMARGIAPHLPSHGLDALARIFNLGEKLDEGSALRDVKGVRELSEEQEAKLAHYAEQDVDLTDALYRKLEPAVPEDELQLIHITTRWGCQPVLHVNIPRAKRALAAAIRERETKIQNSGTSLEVLSSQPKFTAYLESLGIEVPTKINKNGDDIPALGKNDLGFRRMVADHPEHANLFAGRLAAKSTLDVTRTKRIVEIGSRGTLPMPLNYFGAHTGRWSGSDGLNPQNFRRGSELRKSIIAPPGYVVLVADLSQIELRINFWYCDELDWLQLFRDGIDVYRGSASVHFSVPLEEVTDAQRFFGKTIELGLGYGMGWKKFRTTCALKEIYLSEAEAYETVREYRASHHKISTQWRKLTNRLPRMYQRDCADDDGPITFIHEGILLPNGMRIDYSDLTPTDTNDWFYGIQKITKIYGGKMLENIIQALARIVVGEQILAIEREGIRTVSSTHDEVIMVVRENEADDAQRRVEEIMTTPPTWAPDLPLGVEAGWAKEYSK